MGARRQSRRARWTRSREAGFWRIGLAGEPTDTLAEAIGTARVALVLGAEGEGMRQNTEAHCDELARLPISAQGGEPQRLQRRRDRALRGGGAGLAAMPAFSLPFGGGLGWGGALAGRRRGHLPAYSGQPTPSPLTAAAPRPLHPASRALPSS